MAFSVTPLIIAGRKSNVFGEGFVTLKVNDSRWADAPGFVVTKCFSDRFEEVRNLEVYSDDIWLLCYPKTGSTWAQEMIWLLNNDMDFETANNVIQTERFPYMEYKYTKIL